MSLSKKIIGLIVGVSVAILIFGLLVVLNWGQWMEGAQMLKNMKVNWLKTLLTPSIAFALIPAGWGVGYYLDSRDNQKDSEEF